MINLRLFVLFLVVFVLNLPAQELVSTQPDLKDLRITLQLEHSSFGDVVRELMSKYDIHVGFEQSMFDRDHNEYAFDINLAIGRVSWQSEDGKLKGDVSVRSVYKAEMHPIRVMAENAPLRDVLDSVVKQMENYKWEINDGVVNIFPSKGRDRRFENLLSMNIGEFNFKKGETVRAITRKISRSSEFQSFLRENNLKFDEFRYGSELLAKAKYDRPVNSDMNFSNTSLRDLLNKVTKIKKGGWSLRVKRNEQFIDLDI